MNSAKRLQSLLAEVDRRRAAQTNLARFIEYRQAGYKPAQHHELLIDRLEAVERGEIERLMVFMPPGSAKSTYTSVEFPAWFAGRNPQASLMAVSHTSDLAERFGRRVRNIVGSREFEAVFGVRLADDSQAAGKWETSKGGEYFAAGVGGSVTGRRADLGVIDDPVRGREDADSERQRETAWQWYLNDFLTRLKPGARQIVVMTRWHQDDLAGRILDREADRWHVVKLPMIAGLADPLGRAPGARLWPEWFTDDMVTLAKQDPRSWTALYQQEPVPEEGAYFKADWFAEFDAQPLRLSIYGASDFAVTDSAGDYTEHGIFGVDHNSNIYALDWWRGQTTADEWIERWCDLVGRHKPLCWFAESGVIRRAIEPALMRRMQERNAYCRVEWMASIHDKATRARAIQARASMGKVWLPKRAAWKPDVLTQLLTFPAGKHDDAVDVFSLLGRGLEHVIDAGKPAAEYEAAHGGDGGWMA